MRTLQISAAATAVAALVAVTAWALGWPVERAAYLAPVLVVAAAALVGLVLLWGKVVYQALQESKRPKLVLALWLVGIVLLVALSILGVKLPREG
jgi:uncharacterized membrane protein